MEITEQYRIVKSVINWMKNKFYFLFQNNSRLNLVNVEDLSCTGNIIFVEWYRGSYACSTENFDATLLEVFL